MNYKEYRKSRDLSWEILTKEKICALPVKMAALCEQTGIELKLYTPTDGNSGFSTIDPDGTAVIGVSRTEPPTRQRFTAAHELGHILLGHTGKYELCNREPQPDDNPIEQAANVFASRLLAPACVLWGCRVQSAEEVAALCGISSAAAEFRFKRMQILFKRNKFLLSPKERAVFEQFKDYIAAHRLR